MEDVERLVFLAVRAGAFRAAARDYPEAAETFTAAADLNSARAATLADTIAKAGPGKVSSVRMAGRQER